MSLKVFKKAAAGSPVYHPVVKGEAEAYAGLHPHLAVMGHGCLPHAPHPQDDALGRVDDRGEVIHIPGPQIGDSERCR